MGGKSKGINREPLGNQGRNFGDYLNLLRGIRRCGLNCAINCVISAKHFKRYDAIKMPLEMNRLPTQNLVNHIVNAQQRPRLGFRLRRGLARLMDQQRRPVVEDAA